MIYLTWAREDPSAAREWVRTFPDIDEKERNRILRGTQ